MERKEKMERKGKNGKEGGKWEGRQNVEEKGNNRKRQDPKKGQYEKTRQDGKKAIRLEGRYKTEKWLPKTKKRKNNNTVIIKI